MSEPQGQKTPWHQSFVFILGSFLVIGPLALPLVWTNKKLSIPSKIILTLIMVIVTIFLLRFTARIIGNLEKQMADLKAVMQP